MKPELEDIIGGMFSEFKLLKDEEAKEDFWSDLTESQSYAINKEYLLRTEKPEFDYLVCWEPGRLNENETIFDYPTFYEFDYKWWEFQKEASLESIEEMKKWMENGSKHYTPETISMAMDNHNKKFKNYEMNCTGDWFRLMDGNTFIYAQMISAKWYIYDHLEKTIDELIEKNIPWKFKGDIENWLNAINSNIPEETYEANGRERELESLKTKLNEYNNNELLDIIQNELDNNNYSGKTFRFDRGYSVDNFDPFTDFIFYDIESLKNIRTKSFLKDFKENQEDSVKLDKIIEKLKLKITDDFKKKYEENLGSYEY